MDFVREHYRFNFLIQIEVSSINGLSVVSHVQEADQSGAVVIGSDHSIMKRSNIPLANIFFKVSHEEQGQDIIRYLLVNQEQV